MKKKTTNGLYDKEILQEFTNFPLRSAVIVISAVIDNLLQELIKRTMVDDDSMIKMVFDENKLFETFSSKIKYCYITGLISKELYSDIEILRKIRNICAHSVKLGKNEMQSIEGMEQNFKLLYASFSGFDKEDIKIRIGVECSLIHVALIKKLTVSKNLKPHKYEIDDLGYSDADYEYIKSMQIPYR